MANFLRRGDSSSSSDEDGQYKPVSKITEDHLKKGCKFNKFKTFMDGRTVFVWLRTCSCSQGYSSYAIRRGATSSDNKDVHFSDQCCWKQKKQDGNPVIWQLRRKCVCGRPYTPSYIGFQSHPQQRPVSGRWSYRH